MIIKDEDRKVSPEIAPVGASHIVPSPYDAELSSPPPYCPPEQSGTASTSTNAGNIAYINSSASAPPPLPPVNHLSLRREHSSIKGTYVVDPSLRVPRELLAPLEEGEREEDRPNLRLQTQTASINVDVWVVNGTPEEREDKERVKLEFLGYTGSVNVRLNADFHAWPLSVRVTTQHGSATLALPSSFTGPITFGSKYGAVRVSDAVAARLTLFSEANDVRNCFIGDVRASGFGNGEWTGSRVHVQSQFGKVKISFTDEPAEQSQGSFFSKLFGPW